MLGVLSNFYVNVGTYQSPDWEEIDLVNDLTVNGSWNEGAASVRRTRVDQAEPTTLALELTGTVRSAKSDTGYGILRDAWIGNTPLDCMALNGELDENGVEGFRFDGKVFQWNEDQARGNVLYKSFNIKPCISENNPQYVIVAAGVPTFNEIGEESGS